MNKETLFHDYANFLINHFIIVLFTSVKRWIRHIVKNQVLYKSNDQTKDEWMILSFCFSITVCQRCKTLYFWRCKIYSLKRMKKWKVNEKIIKRSSWHLKKTSNILSIHQYLNNYSKHKTWPYRDICEFF